LEVLLVDSVLLQSDQASGGHFDEGSVMAVFSYPWI